MVQTIASDAVLQNFYDSAQNSNMGMLDSAVASIGDSTNTTSQILSTITPDNNAEANARIVYEIYNTLTDTGLYLMDSIQYQILYNIAIQNPISGGIAVYSARAMIDLMVDDFVPDGAYRLIQTHDSQSADEIKIYPNPASDNFFIESTVEPIETVTLINTLGQRLLYQKANATFLSLNTSSYDDGIYFLKIILANGKLVLKKIVVQK